MFRRRRPFLAVLSLLAIGVVSVPAADTKTAPVIENARLVASTLETLGQPLPASAIKSLEAAILSGDAGEIDAVLNDLSLLSVSINPEGRVKLARGPAPAVLVSGKKQLVLVRVNNLSGGQQLLTVRGAYAGDTKNPFSLAFVSHGKLTPELAGLSVEYRIMAVTASATGKHELSVTIEAGKGTQELGFRGEAPVLFDVRRK
jgi:hypothetical protein